MLRRDRQALERGLEISHHRGIAGVAEVEAVGERPGPTADAGHVAGRLGHRVASAQLRVALAPVGIASDGERQPQGAPRVGADHDRVGLAGPEPGPPLHLAVVVAEQVLARAQVEASQQGQERWARVRMLGAMLVGRRRRAPSRGSLHVPGGGDRLDRAVDHQLFLPADAIARVPGGAPDHARSRAGRDRGQRELSVVEIAQLRREALRHHPAEALLGLRAQHHLGGEGARLVHAVEVDFGATPAGCGQLAGGARHAARAEVLETGRDSPRAQARKGLEVRHREHPLEERIGELHRRPPVLAAEPLRGEGGAAEAALVGRLADQHEGPRALALGHPAPQHAVPRGEAHGHDVDEAVPVEGAVEGDLAAQVRHAERVAVARDPLHHAAGHVARLHAAPWIAEAQDVEHSHDLGSHARHVPHDPADSRRRPLDRQDLARVVVALVRQDEQQVLARRGQAHHAGVLAGTDHDLGRARRKAAQQMARRLVRAVLAPQDAEQHRLGPRGRAPEELEEQRHLVGFEHHAARAQAVGHLGRLTGLLGGERGMEPGGDAHGSGGSARA